MWHSNIDVSCPEGQRAREANFLRFQIFFSSKSKFNHINNDLDSHTGY